MQRSLPACLPGQSSSLSSTIAAFSFPAVDVGAKPCYLLAGASAPLPAELERSGEEGGREGAEGECHRWWAPSFPRWCFRAKPRSLPLGRQVLFCYEQFDELTLLHLREFEKKKLMSVETDIVVDHYKEEKFEESRSGGFPKTVVSASLEMAASCLTPNPALVQTMGLKDGRRGIGHSGCGGNSYKAGSGRQDRVGSQQDSFLPFPSPVLVEGWLDLGCGSFLLF